MTKIQLIELEVADEFTADGLLLLNVLTGVSGEVWLIDDEGVVVAYEDFGELTEGRSVMELRRSESGPWRLASWR